MKITEKFLEKNVYSRPGTKVNYRHLKKWQLRGQGNYRYQIPHAQRAVPSPGLPSTWLILVGSLLRLHLYHV